MTRSFRNDRDLLFRKDEMRIRLLERKGDTDSNIEYNSNAS